MASTLHPFTQRCYGSCCAAYQVSELGRLVVGASGGLTRGGRAPALVKGLPQRQGHAHWKAVQLLLRPSLHHRWCITDGSFLHLPGVKPLWNDLLMDKLHSRGYGVMKTEVTLY